MALSILRKPSTTELLLKLLKYILNNINCLCDLQIWILIKSMWIIFSMCMSLYTSTLRYVHRHACGGQRTAFRSQFSLHHLRFWGLNSGCQARWRASFIFVCCIMLLAYVFKKIIFILCVCGGQKRALNLLLLKLQVVVRAAQRGCWDLDLVLCKSRINS